MKRWIRRTIFILTLAGLGFVIHVTQDALDRGRIIQFEDKRPVFLPKGEVLKWMSMGYRGLMGDWLWIRSVLYFGRRVADEENPYYVYEENKEHGGHEFDAHDHDHQHSLELPDAATLQEDSTLSIPQQVKSLLYDDQNQGLVDYIYPMLDRVTTVDPHFIFPYVFGGLYVLMSTGEIDESLKLLKKGYRFNPDRWELPFYLGWVYWMYRENPELATEYLTEAVGKDGCPHYVGTILAGLSKSINRADITHLYLKSLYESTDNPEIKEQLEEVLQALKE